MPDLDGSEVSRRVRAESDIPILKLTARGVEMDRIVGLELSADDCVPKSFHPCELLARLRAILRRSRSADSLPTVLLRFGRLEIDQDPRLVRIDGYENSLTIYEFELLSTLARNTGRVMWRDALVHRMRRENLEAFECSIDVHILRIRAAIEDTPKHALQIISIRGVGYVVAKNQDE